MHQNGAPICRLHTKLCKGAGNVLVDNSETVGHKDLRLGQIVWKLVFYKIHFLGFFHWTVSNLFFCCVTVKTIYTDKIPFLFWESLPIYIFDQGNMAPVCTCGTGKQKHWSRRWTWEQEPFPGRSGSCTTPIRRKALWDVHWAAQSWGSSKTRLVSRVKDENLNQCFWEIIIRCFSLSKRAQGRIIGPKWKNAVIWWGEGWGTEGECSAVRAPFY